MAYKDLINSTQLPIYKPVFITTDGAPAMTGRINGFIALCKSNVDFPDFLNYRCIIHQQALCGKILNMKDVMDIQFGPEEFDLGQKSAESPLQISTRRR